MKLVFIVVGKTNKRYMVEAVDEYCQRLKHYVPFEYVEIPGLKKTTNLSFEQQKEKEGELLLKQFKPGDYIVLLDDKGKMYTSMAFSQYIEKKQHQSPKRLLFVVGGAYGFSKAVYQKSNEKISLSKMTFSHQMIRLLFVEQLYRGYTILNNEPYHHE